MAEWLGKAAQKRWRDNNRERVRANNRRSSEKHRAKNIERNKDYQLRRKYGITMAQKRELIRTQNGCCAICGDSAELYIDHCHVTNKIRGALCKFCNWGLGSFRDKPDLMLRAINYIDAATTGSGPVPPSGGSSDQPAPSRPGDPTSQTQPPRP